MTDFTPARITFLAAVREKEREREGGGERKGGKITVKAEK